MPSATCNLNGFLSPTLRDKLQEKLHSVTPAYSVQYAIPKIKMLCNLHCLKARLRLLCNKYQRHSSLNLVSQQLKLCNIDFRNGVSFVASPKKFETSCKEGMLHVANTRLHERKIASCDISFRRKFWFFESLGI